MQTRRVEWPSHRITKGKQAEEAHVHLLAEARRHFQRLTTLHEITLAVTSTLDLDTLLDTLLEKIDLFLPYSVAFVWLINRESGRLDRFASRDIAEGEEEWKGMKTEEIRSFTKTVIENKAPLVARNVQSDPRAWNPDFLSKHGLTSYLGVPMSTKGIVLGALCLMTRKEHQFSEEEIEDLNILARQTAVAIDNSQVYEQAKKQALELHNLAGYLDSVRELERTRIAREIHDELAQALTAMKMDVAWLRSRLSEDQASVLDKTKAMSQLIETTMETVRRISTTLRPAILDDLGLVAAIQWQAQEFETRTGVRCKLCLPPKDIAMERHRSTSIFRVFQESLTNVARHANATEVDIALKREGSDLTLEIRDNGRGITDGEIYDVKSLGLLGMRERVLLLRGEFNIRGIKGKGTTVRVRIPRSKSLSG